MRKALITLLAVVTFHGSFAQIENQSYSELFKEAKLNIANHKEKEAIPQLEALYKRDEQNANVAYLLGLCYIKSYTKINQAIKLLESAKEDYSKFYDRTSVTERGVSEYVYYYLVIGYSLKGDCKQTIATLNEFYKIYSYEDEWFLIDGQKWHRDCGKHKWEDKDSIASSRDSRLFGHEKDDSFRSSLANIYQTFDGKELYPSIEEKAAHLLYFIVKNHSFTDGNKRIAAGLFVYFMDINGALFRIDGSKRIGDNALVAITIMIAESRPEEKDIMIKLVVNLINDKN